MVITSTGAGTRGIQGHPQPEGQAHGQCGARAHAQWLTGHHEPHREEGRDADLDAMNGMIRKAALVGDLVNQIHYQVDPELVSSDIIGDTCCSVFDSNATIVSPDGKNVVLYAWYDNEFGYTKQVIRLAKHPPTNA
jgi:glyceraldehyde 3-phosphate dehydrogenase